MILPAPIYPGYEPVIHLAHAKPIYLDTTDNDFVLAPEVLEAALKRTWGASQGSHFELS